MTEDECAIRVLIDHWMAASKVGDTQTVLSLMTEDVVFMVPGKAPFGKTEFATASKAMSNVRMEGTADIQEIQVLGDWAWLRNHLTVTITPPNGEPKTRSGYTLTIFRKAPNGRWLLARDANLMAA